jgi:predicted transcriptional regulator
VGEVKDTMFVRADEIAQDLDVSRPTAYRLIKEMNAELKAKGYMTIAGRVSRQFYVERFYGIAHPLEGGR